jgi:hypothetical protein
LHCAADPFALRIELEQLSKLPDREAYRLFDGGHPLA